jgi:hypothetical protein
MRDEERETRNEERGMGDDAQSWLNFGRFRIILGPISNRNSSNFEPTLSVIWLSNLLSDRFAFLISHHSFLIPHFSLLISHLSSLIPPPSSLIPHPSSLIPHPSSLISHPSSLIPPFSFLVPRSSSVIPHL